METEFQGLQGDHHVRNAAVDHKNAGIQFSVKRRSEEAIAEFDESLRLDPEAADTYRYRGDAYFELDEFPIAAEDFNKAIRLDPQCAMAYYKRSRIYSECGENQRAIEDLEKFIRLDPQHAIAFNNRGVLYYQLGEKCKALKDFEEAGDLHREVGRPLQPGPGRGLGPSDGPTAGRRLSEIS